MAKNLKTTGDAVSSAMFLIDRRIKYNEIVEEERVTNKLLNIVDSNSTTTELETVPEDNPVKSTSSTTTRSPVIIEGILLTKSSPSLPKSIFSLPII